MYITETYFFPRGIVVHGCNITSCNFITCCLAYRGGWGLNGAWVSHHLLKHSEMNQEHLYLWLILLASWLANQTAVARLFKCCVFKSPMNNHKLYCPYCKHTVPMEFFVIFLFCFVFCFTSSIFPHPIDHISS